MSIAILGGGLAGLTAAKSLTQNNHKVTIIEKEKELGGLLRTDECNGSYFDFGPHIFFHTDPLFLKIFREALSKIGIVQKPARTGQWSYKTLIDFPYVYHLKPLPVNIVTNCLIDFTKKQIELGKQKIKPPGNYEEFCRTYFGNSLTDCFMLNYAEKIWTVKADQLDTDWVGTRIILPEIEEVIKGALSDRKLAGNYIKEFKYPKKEGTQSFFNGFLSTINKKPDYKLDTKIERIDLKKKYISFVNGEKLHYEYIISTIPLPELKDIIVNLPNNIKECFNSLKWFGVLLLNYASNEILDNPYQWIYFDQDDALFHRIHYPTKLSKQMSNYSFSIQAEISFSNYRPLPAAIDLLLEKGWKDLEKLNFVTKGAMPNIAFTRSLDYAYAIMDKSRLYNVQKIRTYLEANSIYTCGRFGEWDYIWTDKVLHSSLNAVAKVSKLLRHNYQISS
jgi:UDP-galactopyranose mutase